MATRKTEPETPPAETSRNALVILTVGCLLVAGLVVWALTRTVEPAAAPAPVADQTSTYTPPPLSTQPLPTDTSSPIQISMNGGPPQAVPSGTMPQSLPQGALSPPSDKSSVRRIAAEDLRDKLNAGNIILIDVRDAASYAQGHIPGAIHMAFASVQSQMSSLPHGKEIITYCTCPAEESSGGAALVLNAGGFPNVSALHGGLDSWRRIGGAIQTGGPQ